MAVRVFLCFQVVMFRSFTGTGSAARPSTEEEARVTIVAGNFFPAVGVVAFAFVCHHSCFIVFNSLKVSCCWCCCWNGTQTVPLLLGGVCTVPHLLWVHVLYCDAQDNTQARWRKTTAISVGSALTACLLLAVPGYLTFRGLTAVGCQAPAASHCVCEHDI